MWNRSLLKDALKELTRLQRLLRRGAWLDHPIVDAELIREIKKVLKEKE